MVLNMTSKKLRHMPELNRAFGRTRTGDPRITNALRYQLRYESKVTDPGIEPGFEP